jgi:hypothetical protein
MRLDPLRVACVQPAPKSRLAVSGLSAYEDQDQIKSRSGVSRLKPVLLTARFICRTGFSREAFDADPADRSHALCGNAARDASRPVGLDVDKQTFPDVVIRLNAYFL